MSVARTPPPANAPLNGAQPNQNWILADFLTQAQGQYNVVNRPRGPQGLFTLQNTPTGTAPPPAANNAIGAWWATWSLTPGTLSFGQTNGGFDAIELLRGESLDPTNPSAWFTEFLQVRSDWFGLLNQQSPAFFTKALGLSSAKFSIDTPVGLARTYLKANPMPSIDANGSPVLSGVLTALQSGAAVASTGPFLDVSIGTTGPGGLVPGPVQSVTLNINLWMTDWLPVDEIRVIVNGSLAQTISPAALALSAADPRLFSGSVTLPVAQLSGGADAWVVVEAGVPLAGPTITLANQSLWDTWNAIMRSIYPIAVTNPIFVDVKGDGYPKPTS